MNNKVLIAVIIGVIVIGAGLYLGLRKPEGSPNLAPYANNSLATEEVENNAKRMESLKALMASGESIACNYTREDEGGTQSGTVFFADGKMRGNFTMTQQGAGTYEMHTINDGAYSYTWGGPMGAAQGTKMKMPAMMSGEASAENKGLDYDTPMDFDCSQWDADTAEFTPPADVTFTDLSAFVPPAVPRTPGGEAGSQTAPSAQCAACDQVPAESRAQCLAALGC
jgi:hypothetical protein